MGSWWSPEKYFLKLTFRVPDLYLNNLHEVESTVSDQEQLLATRHLSVQQLSQPGALL